MICKPCTKGRHENCPGNAENWRFTEGGNQHPTGLSPEGDAIQRSGLCPCHHRMTETEATNAKIRLAIATETMIKMGKK